MIDSLGFFDGAGEKSRTPDLRITNALLYQLSYTGDEPAILAASPAAASHFVTAKATAAAAVVGIAPRQPASRW